MHLRICAVVLCIAIVRCTLATEAAQEKHTNDDLYMINDGEFPEGSGNDEFPPDLEQSGSGDKENDDEDMTGTRIEPINPKKTDIHDVHMKPTQAIYPVDNEIPIDTKDYGSDMDDTDMDDTNVHMKMNERSPSFFAQPGILAAVIGGAVVGLLCAILLVMFIVYRMRKKDEGTYTLDGTNRTPTITSPYQKTPVSGREFYA